MPTKQTAAVAAVAVLAVVSTATLAQVATRPAPILTQTQVNPNAVAAANAQLNTANLIASLDARVKALEAKSASQANTIATLQTRLANAVSAYNQHQHQGTTTNIDISSFSIGPNGKLRYLPPNATGASVDASSWKFVVETSSVGINYKLANPQMK